MSSSPLKINVCSETALLRMKGEGVNTAFIDCVELLKEGKDVDVVVNQEERGDLMHSHTYGPYYFLRGLAYRNKKILTVHVIPDSIKGSLPWAKTLMPFVKWYFKQVYSYADVCIAISPMVEKVIRDLGVQSKIVRLSNPLQLEKWKRTKELRAKGRAILGLKENEFCVIGVGQLQQRKGPQDFIEIGKQIPNAQFRWIGGRPFGLMTEGIKKLNKQIDEAPANIQFAGLFSLEDMPCLYAAADMMLFLSYQENSPLAPIEAAASGIPVIYRNLEEYRLLYHNEYLKASTNAQFTDWVNQLMNDENTYSHGVKVSQQLITQFEKENIRRQLMRLYRNVNEQSQPQRNQKGIFNSAPEIASAT
jgi:1,2-diacylglycerol-3-alpha-glucose alpha-1,2-galactosyltransferase